MSRIKTMQQIGGELYTAIVANMLGNRRTPSKYQSGRHNVKVAAEQGQPVPNGNGFLKIDEAGKEWPDSIGGKHNAIVETRQKVSNAYGLQPGDSGLRGREQDLITGSKASVRDKQHSLTKLD